MVVKIVIVGAGSVVFSKNLLADILSYPELRDATIALHDVDADRLATAQRLAGYVAERAGAHPRIQADLDRRKLLPGADFVITTVLVGGHRAAELDFDVPARHGIQYTMADTVGVGGIMRALRTLPVVLELAEQMEELCPNAWLFNYTNPMSILCWAVARASRIKVLGLCHSVYWTIHELAEWLGVPMDQVSSLSAGINHLAWVLRLEHQGEDLYPRLRAMVEAGEIPADELVRAETFRYVGYYPTEASSHHAEYVPYYLQHADEVRRLRVPLREFLRRNQSRMGQYEETRRQLAAGEEIAIEPSSEYAAEIIHSMLTGRPAEIVGNVMNDEALISNLPRAANVEVPCLVNGLGVTPVAVGALPPQCAALIHPLIALQDLTVQGVLEEDSEKIYRAALLDPVLTAQLPLPRIWEMLDDVIAAEAEWMPGWLHADRIRSHSVRTIDRPIDDRRTAP